MGKIVSLTVDKHHYEADAAIFWCVDDRFSGRYGRADGDRRLLDEFIREKGFSRIDLFIIAGGAKGFADVEETLDKTFLFSQLEKSIQLHKPTSIIFMVHADCGAYARTFVTPDAEHEFYANELTRAGEAVERFLQEREVSIPIELYFAHFEGLDKIS